MKAANKKEEQRRLLKVGVFLTVTLVFIIGIVLILGRTRSLFNEKFYFYTYFDNVGGLIVGSPVLIGEYKVGEVRSIQFVMKKEDQDRQKEQWPELEMKRQHGCVQFLPNPKNVENPEVEAMDIKLPRVRVEFIIQKEYIGYLRQKSKAALWSKGILGDAQLNIAFSEMDNKDNPTLKNHSCISSAYERSLREQLNSLERKTLTTLDDISSVAKTFEQKLNSVLDDNAIAEIHKLISNVAQIVGDIKQGKGLLHDLIYDPALADSTRKTLHEAHQFVKRAKEGMGQLSSALLRINQILKAVQSGTGTLHQLIYGDQGTKLLESLRQSASGVDDLLKEIKHGTGVIHNLVYEKDTSHLVERLADSAKTLQKILQEVEQGKGTLGGLIKDPSIYRSIKRIVLSVQRGWFLKSVLRSFNEEGEQMEEKDKK